MRRFLRSVGRNANHILNMIIGSSPDKLKELGKAGECDRIYRGASFSRPALTESCWVKEKK